MVRSSGDDVANSVATTLFNAWLGKFTSMAVGDERFVRGMPGATGDTLRMRVMSRMVQGRGPGNPLDLAEYNAATEESAFFDVPSRAEVLLVPVPPARVEALSESAARLPAAA